MTFHLIPQGINFFTLAIGRCSFFCFWKNHGHGDYPQAEMEQAGNLPINYSYGVTVYKILIVGLGGFIGSIARYIAAKAVDDKLGPVFPYGTLAVNLVGSFLLGVIYALVIRKAGLTENGRLFLGVGFCGGFTTFSAFALENFNLLHEKLIGTSLLYICLSLVGGILALAGGIWAARFI